LKFSDNGNPGDNHGGNGSTVQKEHIKEHQIPLLLSDIQAPAYLLVSALLTVIGIYSYSSLIKHNGYLAIGSRAWGGGVSRGFKKPSQCEISSSEFLARERER